MRSITCLTMIVLALALVMHEVVGAERPNVVFIAIDDLKPLIGAYGDPIAKTPNIDRLAARGVRFQRAYCQQAVCGPSRASLLCGLRPDSLGIYDLKTKIRRQRPEVVTLPQHFKQQGYQSVGVGKIFDPRNTDQGDDTVSWSQPHVKAWRTPQVDGMPKGRFGYFSPTIVQRMDLELASLRAAGVKGYGPERDGLKKAGLWPATDRADVPDEAYSDCRVALHAQSELKRLHEAGKPFFLAIGFDRPHLPFNAPEKYWAMYDEVDFQLAVPQGLPLGAPAFTGHDSGELRAGYSGTPSEGPIPPERQRQLIHGYYAAASFVDAQVGRVLDAIEELGIGDDTIIVLWGDHGWHLGDHGMFCKHSNFEQAVHSPLIIAAPELQRGAVVEQPVEFLDIYPTLCSQAGIAVPGHLEGQDLGPLVACEPNAEAVAFSQYPRWPSGKPVMGYSFRDLRYRYTRWVTRDEERRVIGEELYDYEADPLERRNLIDDEALAPVRARLSATAVDFLETSVPIGIK